ncbi:MAG: putative nucleotidyltransferase substrate binding domain-containing protein, partial [Deltaproteobacteria bacterium]
IVSIIRSLSNGVGIMGRLRLLKKDPYHGHFALLDNALLPFTASITALTLIMGGNEVGMLERIRELQVSQIISLEQGELLLIAWHTLNEIRLSREMELFPNWGGDASFYLDPETIPDADMERFRDALEVVAILQRHVTITFNSWEDQTAC